jgi:hypothetical protein
MNVQFESQKNRLSLFTELNYGTGNWSSASFNTLHQISYAIFSDTLRWDKLQALSWPGCQDRRAGLQSRQWSAHRRQGQMEVTWR